MDSIRTEQQYKQLLQDTRDWLSLRGEQLKLVLADKLSQILGLVVMSLCIGLLLMLGMVFFGIALAGWLTTYMHAAFAYLIIGAVYLLLIVILVVFRKALIIRPFVAALCNILLEIPDLTPEQLPVKQSELEVKSEQRETNIRQDVDHIQQELSAPSTWVTWLHRLPQIIRFVTTVLPFIQKLLRKRK